MVCKRSGTHSYSTGGAVTSYQWVVEQVDRHGNVVAKHPQPSYAACLALGFGEITLVRDGTAWACVTGGQLAGQFEDLYGNHVGDVPAQYKKMTQ